MATYLNNLSSFKIEEVDTSIFNNSKIGIIVAEWNKEITNSLLKGALSTLLNYGVQENNITIAYVPGSFELTSGAHTLATTKIFDGLICLGCVIRGETPHFDYICQGVTQGITFLNATLDIPIIFGVLTVNNFQQALDRAGGKYGNKGDEAAIALLKMIYLKNSLKF